MDEAAFEFVWDRYLPFLANQDVGGLARYLQARAKGHTEPPGTLDAFLLQLSNTSPRKGMAKVVGQMGAMLLKAGADPDACHDHVCALGHAVRNDNISLTVQLVRAGAQVNPKCSQGGVHTPPLMDAFMSTSPACVDFLVAQGAQIDACDIHGASPMSHAVGLGQLKFQDDLLARGANPLAINPKGETLLHALVQSDYGARDGEIGKDQLATLDRLIAWGVDPMQPDAQGYTPLQWAMKSRRPGMCRELVQREAQWLARGTPAAGYVCSRRF